MIGDVTFGNLSAGTTYRVANFAEDCFNYYCGATLNSGATERALFGSYLGVCDNVGTNTYRFFNFSNGQHPRLDRRLPQPVRLLTR